jgi:4-hydroxybenzoate polyprenyltransferase
MNGESTAPALTSAAPGGLRALVEAMRPRQWSKNVFVLAGILFARRLFDASALAHALAAFALFCAAASAMYLVNDVRDRDADSHHPTKRSRPIASGRLTPSAAIAAAVVLGAVALAGGWMVGRAFAAMLAAYIVLTLSYSAVLKRVFIVDALAIAAGFVLRAAAGAAAVNAVISPWLLSCTFQLALYLALGKRRHELTLLGEGAGSHREALGQYSVALLDSWLTALTGATIVTYALYTQAPRTIENFRTSELIYTVPFVVYALFRYQHIVVVQGKGGEPGSALLRDPGMLVAILGWAATAALVIYAR